MIAAGTSLGLCYGVCVFTCGSLLFLSVSFRSRRFGASNGFVFLRDCFVWLVRNLGFGCFLRRVFFFFHASFSYLEPLYHRYFSSAVFLSACLLLQYHNAVCHMRFPPLIHFMLQLVKGSVDLPFFLGLWTIFLLFCFFDAYSLSWSSVLDC